MKDELEKVQVVIEQAKKTSDYTLFLKKDERKKYVFSKYIPREGVEQLLDREDITKKTLWIIVGFGFGYLVEEIIKLVGEQANILVIEPSQKALDEQKNYTKAERWARLPNLDFFCGMDFDLLRSLFDEKCKNQNVMNLKPIILNGYEEFYLEYCTKVMQCINSVRMNKAVNQNTIKRSASVMANNIIRNGRFIHKSYDIRQHKDKYKNIPAVIVSAGPSLNKNIHLINGFNGIIFSGGRNVADVEKQGTHVDFVCVADSMPAAFEAFNGDVKGEFPLITISEVVSKLIEEHNGPQYFVDTNDGNVMRSVYHVDAVSLEAGGSVSTICLAAAHYMGCNPIVFIGQDFAYSTSLTRYATATKVDEAKSNTKYYKVEGYNGGYVDTKGDLKTFLDWTEVFVAKHPERTYINATEGGAKIKGTIQKPFKEVVGEFKTIQRPQITHEHKLKQEISFSDNIEELLNFSKKANELATKGERLSNKLLEEYRIYKGIRVSKIQDLVKRLEYEVDVELKRLLAYPILNMLFTKQNIDVENNKKYQEQLKENDKQQGIRLAELSCRTYESSKRAAKEAIEMVEAIKRECDL